MFKHFTPFYVRNSSVYRSLAGYISDNSPFNACNADCPYFYRNCQKEKNTHYCSKCRVGADLYGIDYFLPGISAQVPFVTVRKSGGINAVTIV